MSALDLRVGDVVRLKPMKVESACGETVGLVPLDSKSDRTECVWLEHIESIISRAETPKETIARLEAELAKAPRRIEWGGGSCPTDKAVVIWQRNGKTFQAMGYAFDWRHRSEPDDIIAYMVLPS